MGPISKAWESGRMYMLMQGLTEEQVELGRLPFMAGYIGAMIHVQECESSDQLAILKVEFHLELHRMAAAREERLGTVKGVAAAGSGVPN